MTRITLALVVLVFGCSSGDDSGGSAGGAGGAGGGGGIADAGCDAHELLDGSCPGVGAGGGTGGGTGGGAPSCESAGLVQCVGKPSEWWEECDRIAFECVAGAGLGYTGQTGCTELGGVPGNPYCCDSWEKQCQSVATVNCAALGGVSECFQCRLDNGAPYDENSCQKAGASCTTNNQCCNRCCREEGTCV